MRAQAASIEEDIRESEADKQALLARISEEGPSDSLNLQVVSLEASMKRTEDDLQRLRSKINKLKYAAENRCQSLEQDLASAEERLVAFNFNGVAHVAASMSPLPEQKEGINVPPLPEQKEGINVPDHERHQVLRSNKSSNGAMKDTSSETTVKLDLDMLKLKYSSVKERMVIAEVSI